MDDLDFVVSRYELVAEMPLVADSRYDKGSVHVRIRRLIQSDDGVTIKFDQSSANLLFGKAALVSNQLIDPRQKGDPIYLLVNRGRKEATFVGNGGSVSTATIFGGRIVQQSVELPFKGKADPRAPSIDSHWLAGASLVRLERIPVAEFSKTVEVEFSKLSEPWLSLRAQESTTVSLPVERSSKNQTNEGTAIRISKSGIVTLDGNAVSDEQLKALLVRTHTVDANASVLIIAEKGSELGETVLVVDACRMAGINKLRIQSH